MPAVTLQRFNVSTTTKVMEVRSTYKYARISPFKAREVTREIQGLPVSAALDLLAFTPKKAAFLINKTLKSAIANAENNANLKPDGLVVKEAVVGEGPTKSRLRPGRLEERNGQRNRGPRRRRRKPQPARRPKSRQLSKNRERKRRPKNRKSNSYCIEVWDKKLIRLAFGWA